LISNAVAGSNKLLIADFAYNTPVIHVIHSLIEKSADPELISTCSVILEQFAENKCIPHWSQVMVTFCAKYLFKVSSQFKQNGLSILASIANNCDEAETVDMVIDGHTLM